MESRRESVRTAAVPVRVRPFRDADYAHLVRIGTASFPDDPFSEAEVRHNDGAWDHSRYWFIRFVAEDPSGTVVGTGRMSHMAYEFHPQKYLMFLTVHPDQRRRGVGSVLFDHVVTELRGRNATSVRTWVQKETMTDSLEFLSHRGFREVQRAWESRLDVAGFDAALFAGAEERAAREGITLTTLAAERARDPEAPRRVYGMISAILPDVPAVEQVTPATYEQWLGYDVETPKALPDGFFLAKDGNRYVGLSFLQRRLEQPDVLSQELTGVLREYRGKGIAMALKLQTVEYARAHGYREIRTGNDTRNRPMLRINEAMGFVKQPAAITFERTPP
ncbi:MAG: GNAT family N-acetyltransferase [Gemmatimonadales bacterium]